MANVFEGAPDARQSEEVGHRVSRFRPTYRALTADEKALHDTIKNKAVELERLIEMIQPQRFDSPSPRYCALALTSLEEAIMWAIKGLTA